MNAGSKFQEGGVPLTDLYKLLDCTLNTKPTGDTRSVIINDSWHHSLTVKTMIHNTFRMISF